MGLVIAGTAMVGTGPASQPPQFLRWLGKGVSCHLGWFLKFYCFFFFFQCGAVDRSSLLYVVVAARVVGSPVSKYSRNALCV